MNTRNSRTIENDPRRAPTKVQVAMAIKEDFLISDWLIFLHVFRGKVISALVHDVEPFVFHLLKSTCFGLTGSELS